ncbi:response regulator [Limisphaera sp. 4302-co]|uniref:response regulator n=1 Tax=Limisphaera sp. 4302-co TaxID=3400417 RepID=UPI003C167CE1
MMKAAEAGSGSVPYRVLVVDEAPLMREAIRCCLERDGRFAVVGEAGTAATALEFVSSHRPALVVTDLALPGRSGLELIRDLRSQHPEVRVLVFTFCDERLYAGRALRAGARGFLHKRAEARTLVAAAWQVVSGRLAVETELALHLVEELIGGETRRGGDMQALTDRELEVLRLLGRARTVREIAATLHLSPKTVETHKVNLMRKLGLKSSAELLRFALQWAEQELVGGPFPRVASVPQRPVEGIETAAVSTAAKAGDVSRKRS